MRVFYLLGACCQARKKSIDSNTKCLILKEFMQT